MQIWIQSLISAFWSLTSVTVRSRFCMLWLSSMLHTRRWVCKCDHCALSTDSWCRTIKAPFLAWREYLLTLSKAGLHMRSDVSPAAGSPQRRQRPKELSGALITATTCYEPKAASPHHVLLVARIAIHHHWHARYLIPFEDFSAPRSSREQTPTWQSYHRHIQWSLQNKAIHMMPRLKGQKVAVVKVNIWHYLLEQISHIFTIWSTEVLEGRARALQSQSVGQQRKKHVEWRLAMEGLGILECFSRSTSEKLHIRDRQGSLPPERLHMLSSVKEGHLEFLKCWLRVKRHPYAVICERGALRVFEMLAQGQKTSRGNSLWM